jgi:8-oxo-dGTP pyrophosphatase MutT (NUDIX family)
VLAILPPEAAARARAVADGDETAVPLRPASTVVLVRESPSGIQAYVQRRHSSLQFAAGMHAFPGGRVDPGDADAPAWVGPGPDEWALRFGSSPAVAIAHVVAVVRELFEEAGVLLATPVDDRATWPAEHDRALLADGTQPLAALLERHRLALDCRRLRGWSVWLTPRFERRRFDTWFFVAALPENQSPRVASEESHDGRWVDPRTACDEAEAGTTAMLPPTWWTLREIERAGAVEAMLADPPPMARYTAGWVPHGDGARLVLPDDPRYPGCDPREGT